MENLIDYAGFDTDLLVVFREQGENFGQLENFWNVDDYCTKDDREDVAEEDPPEPLLEESDLISVRRADGVVALNSDSNGHEDTGGDGNMTQTITPRCQDVKDGALWKQCGAGQDEVGQDDQQVHHAEDHQQLVEQVIHPSGRLRY